MSPRRRDLDRVSRSLPSAWRVSSCSSRAQRPRSASAAATRCRRRSIAADWAVATAVAALAGNAPRRVLVFGAELAVIEVVQRHQHAVGAVAEGERDDQSVLGTDAEMAGAVLLEAG